MGKQFIVETLNITENWHIEREKAECRQAASE